MWQEFQIRMLNLMTKVQSSIAKGIEAVVAIDHTSQGNPTTLRWLLYDGHGNLVRTMAPDYALSAWQFRGVWGEVQGNLALGRGYCANLGHPEGETGLVYMRARYYEPTTGRFISEDPARDGVNWYLYADGNPVNKVDVEGQRALPSPFITIRPHSRPRAMGGVLALHFNTLGTIIEPFSGILLMGLTIISILNSWVAIHAIRKWRALELPYPWYQLLIDFCLPLWTILLMVCIGAGVRFRDGLPVGATLVVLWVQITWWTPEKLARLHPLDGEQSGERRQ